MDTNNTSAENNEDKDLPGYPHYPATEDVSQPENNNGIVSLDTTREEKDNETENDDIVMGTEADVTADDLALLDGIEEGRNFLDVKDLLDSTDNEGDPLSEDNTASGLDVPGSELDDENERIGAEDEENNYYSLGSDNNDNLEESEDR
jgi:hypothetical protein